MSQEVIIKKAENDFYAAIPSLGILEQAKTLQEAYDLALVKSQKITATYSAVQLEHLLKVETVPANPKRHSLLIAGALVLGLLLFGLTVGKSIQRASESLKSNLFETDPKRMEKNREKFRALLEKYRPLIEEWQKATEKP